MKFRNADRVVEAAGVEPAWILLWQQTSQLQEVTLKPYLESFVAMDRNGDSDLTASFGVDMVTAVDALQRPSV